MNSSLKKSKSRVVIGDYQMIRLLGEGTTAKVFLAEHNKTKTLIAIKRIRIDFINENASNREYFFNELQIMNKLKHPNLLHCYELYQTSNNFYILMEFCNKGSLKHLRGNKGGLGEVQSVCYLRQIMEGFKALRRHQIIHRDVKLENLLIKDDVLKIADFGTAKRGMESTSTKMIGSFLTMAPEVMKVFSNNEDEDTYSSKVDLWSIGVVFYEILFGESPFFGSYPAQMIHNMRNLSGANLKMLKKVSPEVEDLLKNLLQFDPKNRISWENFFKHPVFSKYALPEKLDKVYKEYKLKQFDKGKRLRNGSKRIRPRKKLQMAYVAKSVSKNPHLRKESQLLQPKPMKTIENLSNIYKSKEKLKKSSKHSSKMFTTSILDGSGGGDAIITPKKKSSEFKSKDRSGSYNLSKMSTMKSNTSPTNDKNSSTLSQTRKRCYSDQIPAVKNQLIFSKVSNKVSNNNLQYSITLPFQRNSMNTNTKRGKKTFLSNIKNYVPEIDEVSGRISKSSNKSSLKKKARRALKKSKSTKKEKKSLTKRKKSEKIGNYKDIFGTSSYQKKKSANASRKKILKNADNEIKTKKMKIFRKYKLEFQMRLISNRYFHEKNKILFINITLKNIRDFINKNSFREIEKNLYICVIYLMKKAIYQSELILKSLQFKRNLFNIDFFQEYTESKNHLEMIREYSEDWTNCKNYFSIFAETIRSKKFSYKSRLEEHISFLSKRAHVTPKNLHQMLTTQFKTLVLYEPFSEMVSEKSISGNEPKISDKKGKSERKRKQKVETEYYRMMVQLKYSIFADECFPYVTENNFFDWKDFFNKFQSYKKDKLRRIIKNN